MIAYTLRPMMRNRPDHVGELLAHCAERLLGRHVFCPFITPNKEDPIRCYSGKSMCVKPDLPQSLRKKVVSFWFNLQKGCVPPDIKSSCSHLSPYTVPRGDSQPGSQLVFKSSLAKITGRGGDKTHEVPYPSLFISGRHHPSFQRD